MKKIVILLFSSLLAVHTVVAQKEYAQIPVADLNLPLNTLQNIIPVVDENGLTCLAISSHSMANYKFALVSPQGKVVMQQGQQTTLSFAPEFIGITTSDKHFLFYARPRKGDTFAVTPVSVDKATGEVHNFSAVALPVDRESKFVTSFSEGNILHLVFFGKKNNELKVCRLSGDHVLDVKRFVVEFRFVHDYFTKAGDWAYMDKDAYKNMYAGHVNKKLYKAGNELVFVHDDYPLEANSGSSKSFTHIVKLDLQQETVTMKSFTFPKTARGYSTSLHGSNLFKFTVIPRELNLEVYNVESQSLLKQHTFLKNEPIAFKVSPVYNKSTDNVWVTKYTDKATEASDIRSRLAKGYPAVIADPADANTLLLTLGSYAIPRTGGGGMMMPGGGGTIATPYGAVAMPTTYSYVGNPRFNDKGDGVGTYFRALLDVNTLEKAQPGEKPSMPEVLDKFEEQLYRNNSHNIGATAVVKNNNTVYYTYLDKKTKLLKIVIFDM